MTDDASTPPDNPNTSDNDEESGVSVVSILVTVAALAALAACYFTGQLFELPGLMAQVVVISVVIWQACDPFADAAQWIGTTFRIPGSVRGATLDAVASSMPELFSGVFFVVVAIVAAGGDAEVDTAKAAGEGYSAALATCAGSAIYNMILIPAFCALFISWNRKSRPTIDIDSVVITRDGMWFLGCEFFLLMCLYQDYMHWAMGIVFLGLYCGYVTHLYTDARAYRRAHDAIAEHLADAGTGASTIDVLEALQADGVKANASLVETVRAHGDADDDEDEAPDTAGFLFGLGEIPLSQATAWGVILVSTLVAAAACYWLVEVTYATAEKLEVNTFFIAVILAAAASSVPDTFLSIGAAMRGDDDGAVSNAFGSNIFDICICLSVPLFVTTSMNGWQIVYLTENGAADGAPLPGLLGLRILLFVLSFITLGIMWHNRQLTRNKAYILCGLYAIFVGYAVLGSLNLIPGM